MQVIRKLVILSNKQEETLKGVVAFENVAGKVVCTATTQGEVQDCVLYIRNGENFLPPKRADVASIAMDLGEIQLANDIECILHNGDKTVMRGAFPGKGRGCGDVIAGCLEKFGAEEIGLGSAVVIEEVAENLAEKAQISAKLDDEELPPIAEDISIDWGQPENPDEVQTIPPVGEWESVTTPADFYSPNNEAAETHYIYARDENAVAVDVVESDVQEEVQEQAQQIEPEKQVEEVVATPADDLAASEIAPAPCGCNKQKAPYAVLGEEDSDIYTSERPFYDAVSAQLLGLFAVNPQEESLAVAIPNSQFCKVKHGRSYYVVGLISEGEKPRYICYGTPARAGIAKKEFESCCDFVRTCSKNPKKGYYLTFQDAVTGKTVVRG